MTAAEILTQVKKDIRQTGGGGFTDGQLLSFLNEGYVDFCRFTECVEKHTEIPVPIHEAVFSTPTDFLEARQYGWSDEPLYLQDEVHLDDEAGSWTFQVGTPEAVVYFNWKASRIYPIPSSAGTVRVLHAYIPADLGLSDSPDLPEVYHDALVDYVNAEALAVMREYSASAIARGSYEARRLKARAQSNRGQRTPGVLVSRRPLSVFNQRQWSWRRT